MPYAEIILLEMLLFEDELGVKTTRPSNENVKKVEGDSHINSELSDQEPYITLYMLEKR